ncbi:MAG: aminotransferase class I/II-fold pyridoxal phosphate-dependent enzyme, partial [Caldilineaceae bacterium]|nr:aminotransferase class I/II-fold pyridoxal phosphate-dependent enzyme [Caldilineaceae bacterium]
PPTFGMYSFDAGLVGGRVIDVWRAADYSIDVEGICAHFAEQDESNAIKLLFLTSPNNPSGNWLTDADLARLLALPVLVVLDEAYVEFADHPSRADWVLTHANLVVLRTFSKAAGIAGLRLGYGICPSWLMAQLWKFKQPYNVNVAASVAGLASLRHVDQIMAVVDQIKQERARLFDALAAIPFLDPLPSQANFILCSVRDRTARAVKQALEAQGVLVRYYNKPGLDNCIRISVGRPDQTARLLAVLRSLA